MQSKTVLMFAACGEIATGLALLCVPSLVAGLLLGQELTGIAVAIARVAGIALIGLGMACWRSALLGMLTYSGLVGLYLAYLSVADGLTGLLMWPVVVLHLILAALLMRGAISEKTERAFLANH
jgi:hypothetical protein